MIKYAATGISAFALLHACEGSGASTGAAAPKAELDPVKVAPDIYAAKLENDYVRAILTTARPGEFTPLHAHPGRAAIFLNDCIDRRTGDKGETIERKFAAGDVVWAPAETHGAFRYTFVEECRIIEVEVKGAT
jgi:hypothetical protein